ncbi:trypsin-like peptidase domain-containing protein [Streptomyces sp. SCSIO ZS0520]|uniref:trypsin-like peptidase domain-containing protein n=1 Tax=Streptomyces sp. SCSIO ZS0520 TaxID=2892996 RepID=UPI0021DAF79F|nr:trypsin-like peptidase domain-containing protein [Streptomyces sp. SCSIO ZS0520]
MPPHHPGNPESALLDSVVALESPSPRGPLLGTGFFVAPDIVATCAHVVADAPDELPASITGRIASRSLALEFEVLPEHYHLTPGGVDLAFLKLLDAEDLTRGNAVLLSERIEVGDALWAFGHPTGMFRPGQSASFTYEGVSSRSFENPGVLRRLRGATVGGGFSGSPVLNRRTGCIAGMLSTADKTGSSHMVSAGDVLERMEAGWRDSRWGSDGQKWLQRLSDAQIEAGGWPFLGPRLREYLNTSVRAAREHPYPGVIPGTTPPPLSAVYVHQHAMAHRAHDGATRDTAAHDLVVDDEARAPADSILDHSDDVVVIGGPGSGKSSLLRSWITAVARRWDEDHFHHAIPVLVKAIDLVGERPFSSLVHDSVSRELSSAGLVRPLAPDLFTAPPAPGVRWMLLVDGLDEVLSPESRRNLLRKLAAIRQQDEYSALFRFALTTRSVRELHELKHWRCRTYSLLPFDSQQLPGFVRAWLTALELPDPDTRARTFLETVKSSSMQNLLTVPLMATMVCQLYAHSESAALPRGRWALYSDFIALLQEKQYGEKVDMLGQAHSLLDRYGVEAAYAAEQLSARATTVLQEFALARYEGATESARVLIAERTRDLKPSSLTSERWNALCEEVLLRSGLLVRRGEALEFLHQTLLEYLAAQATVADRRRDRRAYRTVVGRWPSRRRAVPPAGAENPYVDFLVSSWSGRSGFGRLLYRWTKEVHGAQYVARLHGEGSAVPQRVVDRAAAELLGATRDDRLEAFDRLRAARSLVELGDPRGTQALHRFAHPPHDIGTRLLAAEMLADLDEPEAAEHLFAVTEDRLAGTSRQIRAAESLSGLGDERGAERLIAIAQAPHIWAVERLRAAEALDWARPDLALDCLLDLAIGHRSLPHIRSAAVESISRLYPYTACASLRGVAEDPRRSMAQRLRALEALEWLGTAAAVDALAETALDSGTDPFFRLSAAEGLSRSRDARATRILADILDAPELGADLALRAAEAMAQLGDPQAADYLLNAATATGIPAPRRVDAARALLSLSDPRGRELLLSVAGDSAADTLIRLVAAEDLHNTGDRRAIYPLTVIALHPSVSRVHQFRAAERLDQFRTRKASGALLLVLENEELLDSMRIQAGEFLAGLREPAAGDALNALAQSAFSPPLRIRAALALGKVTDDGVAALLHSFVDSPDFDDTERIAALEALSALDARLARTVLPQVAADIWQLTPVRVRALTLTRGPRIPEDLATYRDLAAEGTAPLRVRVEAVHVLECRGGPEVRAFLHRLLRRTRGSHLPSRILISLCRLHHEPAYDKARDFILNSRYAAAHRMEVLNALSHLPRPASRRLLTAISTDRNLPKVLRKRSRQMLQVASER